MFGVNATGASGLTFVRAFSVRAESEHLFQRATLAARAMSSSSRHAGRHPKLVNLGCRNLHYSQVRWYGRQLALIVTSTSLELFQNARRR